MGRCITGKVETKSEITEERAIVVRERSSIEKVEAIWEDSIQFSMETEFCEFSPELEDHFEILEHIRGLNVTIVTLANTQDKTLPPWSSFLQKR